MPRFVRVGDKTQIAGTIANLTGKAVKGTAVFTLFDPMTEKVIATQRQKFLVEAGRNTAVNFHFEVSDRYDLLGIRMVADGGTFSDGEQHLLPVLRNKEYITETLAMSIRGEETRTFSLDSLFNRNSRTATDRRLTVEFTGNPAWYAVQALPALSLPIMPFLGLQLGMPIVWQASLPTASPALRLYLTVGRLPVARKKPSSASWRRIRM